MPIYEVEGPDGKVYEIEGDTPPTDDELDEIFKNLNSRAPGAPGINPNLAANLAASEKHVKPEQGIGDLLSGIGSQGMDAVGGLLKEAIPQSMDPVELTKLIPGMGLHRALLNAPQMVEGQLDRSAENMQGFENPILKSLASLPVVGDTMANARRGVEEGDLKSAGRAIFDVGTLATPPGASAAKVPVNAAGRAIRPSQLARANRAVGSSPFGEVAGTVIGTAAHHPWVGNRLGRILTKGSDIAFQGRDKLADLLDPSGSSQALQAQIESAMQSPPKVYEGPAIELPVAEGTTKPVHKSIMSQQDPNAYLKEQIEPPKIKSPEELWAEQMIEEEAGGRPLIPEPVEPIMAPFEANPAPYADMPAIPPRPSGGLENAFARTAQEQAVSTAERQGRQAQRQIEKILSGRTGKPKIEEIIAPETVIDDAPMQYTSEPTDMPGYSPRTPAEQHAADIAFREKLMRDEILKPPSEAIPTDFPTEVSPVEKFAKLEGSDQATTSSGKLVRKGQGRLKGLEAEQAEASNLSNVSPYGLGDLAPNATRHKLKNPRMKGTSPRQVKAKENAVAIRKGDMKYEDLSGREKQVFDKYYSPSGKRKKSPKVNDPLQSEVEGHIAALGTRLKELRPTANTVKGFRKLDEDAYGKATGKYGEGEAHLDFDQIRANAESSVDSRGLKGEARSKAIAQDIATKSIDATIHEAAHGPSKGHGADFEARMKDLRDAMGRGEYERLVKELRNKIMKVYQ